jgi:hypothetical protein
MMQSKTRRKLSFFPPSVRSYLHLIDTYDQQTKAERLNRIFSCDGMSLINTIGMHRQSLDDDKLTKGNQI